MKKLVGLLLLCLCMAASAQAQQTTQQFGAYVNGLPAATTPFASTDKLYVLQGGVSKSVPVVTVSPTNSVLGPLTSVIGHLSCWNNLTGTLLSDCGIVATSLASLSAIDQTITGGSNVTSFSIGTVSSGTTTIDCGRSQLQFFTNGGASTIAAPNLDGNCMVLTTNNASAGTLSFSGFSVGANTGDTLTTVNGSSFSIFVWRINGIAGYRIAAHQ